jgi:hypothetical protein
MIFSYSPVSVEGVFRRVIGHGFDPPRLDLRIATRLPLRARFRNRQERRRASSSHRPSVAPANEIVGGSRRGPDGFTSVSPNLTSIAVVTWRLP